MESDCSELWEINRKRIFWYIGAKAPILIFRIGALSISQKSLEVSLVI